MASRFSRLPDDTYVEHDPDAGWMGVSRYAHGLATGRPSPRVPVRTSAEHRLELQQGMAADPVVAGAGHGLLFDPTPYVREPSEVLAEHGMPPLRGSEGRGFLQRFGSVAREPDPQRRAAIAEKKMGIVRQASRITRDIDVPNAGERPVYPHNVEYSEPGTSTPFATQLANREHFGNSAVSGNWYDVEAEQVNEAATRQGVSHAVMRRAVAYTSPQKPWNFGHEQEANVRFPNIEGAEAVVERVNTQRTRAANEGRGFDPLETARETTVSAVHQGRVAPDEPGVHPQTLGNMEKVGRVASGRELPSDRIPTPNEKVPNFDIALGAGDQTSRTVRRTAAHAYTSDTWDVRTAGVTDYGQVSGGGAKDPDYAGVAKRPEGQYDVVATSGRRSGFKEGRLPSDQQQHVWRVIRPPAETTQQMFEPTATGERTRRHAEAEQPLPAYNEAEKDWVHEGTKAYRNRWR
jgi:hypothetical protein